MIPYFLLAGTFDALETNLGANIAKTFGSDVLLIGLFALIVLMIFMIKIGAGWETAVVLGLFFFFTLTTRGIRGGYVPSGGFISDIGLVIGVIIGSLIIWMAFFRSR
jgi:hypothetical protein